KILLITIDFIAINITYFIWSWLRKEEGFFTETNSLQYLINTSLIFTYWFILFLFSGLYKSLSARSRVDEFIKILKTVTFGVFLIYLITMDLKNDLNSPFKPSRILILSYWLIMFFFVSHFRILFRTIQRRLLEAGVGGITSVIVGWSNEARQLFDQLEKYPALGYHVIGFISNGKTTTNEEYKGCRILGSLENINQIIKKEKIEELLITLETKSKEEVAKIIDHCDSLPVRFKILPDLYDVLIGKVRTNQIYGLPLIEIMPGPLSVWQKYIKRLFDLVVSLFILIFFLPIWVIVAMVILIDSRGPVLFKQERIGKDEKIFTIYKFRSMFQNAESETGPKWAEKDDPRLTRVGKVIRRPRIDEIPQFINVIKGDMSIVGPRPERPYFVAKLKNKIPLYSQRSRVRPGITGWAQIKGKYDRSMEDVKRKLQYDLFYLENLSLRLDLKIIVNTIYVIISGKGH
ncbi:MAG: undecaprenyl-phosphate glucose phosphotransferase, partial [bacterium]